MVGHLMEREPYWDYMGRRMKEDRSVPEETYKTEISQMQKQIHYLQLRVKELTEEVYDLRKHGPIQLELDI
jgi:cell division protein FtsB